MNCKLSVMIYHRFHGKIARKTMAISRLGEKAVNILSQALADDRPKAFAATLSQRQTHAPASRYQPVRHDDGSSGGDPNRTQALADAIRRLAEEERKEVKVERGPEGVTVRTGSKDDKVTVQQRPDGTLVIKVEGSLLPIIIYPSDGPVTIVTGAGNDEVSVNANVTKGVTIKTGEGADYVEGGSGNDIIYGGSGYDVIYGLNGNDVVYAGSGNDYADGGAGDDKVYGGDGKDILSGGRDNDSIFGGAGDDVMITAAGVDIVDDSQGGDHDLVYAKQGDNVRVNGGSRQVLVQPGDHLGSSVSIDGDESFKVRMQSDLDTLRYIPAGQTLLASLDGSGKSVVIKPDNGAWGPSWRAHPAEGSEPGASFDGTGANAVVRAAPSSRSPYDPDITADDWRRQPPLVGLFHELVHAENYVYGTLPEGMHQEPGEEVFNSERSATGLPWDQNGDGIDDPETRASTENVLRAELGLEEQPSYSGNVARLQPAS
jgi:Ca2+-binding RTX toxin-like protein